MAKKRAASTLPDHENPTSEKQKPGNEIEEIFASKKKKKKESDPELNNPSVEGTNAEQKKVKNKKKKTTMKMKEKSKSKTNSSKADGFSDPPSRPRRRTQDGLAVYSAEELGLGKADAGGTPLCPFDCSCCF
ncbi:hypothetical protein CKAN_01921300 [Cinnamomum micranthum f. kanehirae]|uniref:DUF1764 domain-containing protein n=1 Tax=Cinnamomum micranthum f. kanehirae TaxID=337451 RepID=A0A3S4PGI5_9MAGN|nr:hypothetical protein CKAN_01921300 [Cinnamomum micranthum f. kanehirae]